MGPSKRLKRQKKSNLAGFFVAGFVLISITVAIFLQYSTKNYEDVVHNQMLALQAMDLPKAYSYTSAEFQKTMPFKQYQVFIKENPILIKNISISFSNSTAHDNTAVIKGKIHLQDATTIPIVFHLIKQNLIWKIYRVELNPAIINFKIFEDKQYAFSIKYPAEWNYRQDNPSSVEFNSNDRDHSYYTFISIQVMPLKRYGGSYTKPSEAIEDMQKQISDKASNVTFLDAGSVDLPQNPDEIHGEYFIVEYTYQGQVMKKIQYIFKKDHGDFIYSWEYTSDAKSFHADLGIAKTMYKSWRIQ
jgi:hypothetical protein